MWIQHPEPTGSGEQRPSQICNIKRDIPGVVTDVIDGDTLEVRVMVWLGPRLSGTLFA
jgi:endonuclease YncB( thermonuclease family)